VSGLFGGAPAGRTRGFVYWAPAQLHVGIPKLTMGDLRDREPRRPCGIYAAGTGLVGHPQVAHYIGLLSEIRTCSRQSLWQAVRSRSSSCGVDQSPDLTKGHARGRGGPYCDTNREHSGGKGKQFDLAHLSSPQSALPHHAVSSMSMPDYSLE
jgi:hypothetical protein